ncbi:MAG: rhomboid family intramembrane serine protease, partial [Desulfohalobiaceae bacterium]
DDFPPGKDWGVRETTYLYQLMHQDPDFTSRLRNEQVITRDHHLFHEWQSLRTEFERLLSGVVSIGYGFRPAEPRPITLLTYMFLHGGVLHLIGNMVFLWLVGCVLEMGLGRVVYLALYLVGGVLSVLLYWAIYSQSSTPLVGASGAIAALMGAFTILYGRQRVRIFFSLGFYFNIVKVPGIVLLPVWIGNELLQLGFGGASNVAYVAHLGGLAGGAVLGLVGSRLPGGDSGVFAEQDQETATARLMEDAYARLGRLDLEGARRLLQEVLSRDPGNEAALRLLYNVHRQEPGQPGFHEAAARLMERLRLSREKVSELAATFEDYLKAADRPALDGDLLAGLVDRFTRARRIADAERALASLARTSPVHAALPPALLRMAELHQRSHNPDRSTKLLTLLLQRFPTSEEAALAEQTLRQRRKK